VVELERKKNREEKRLQNKDSILGHKKTDRAIFFTLLRKKKVTKIKKN
jgi:hypothetical protein